LSKKFSNAIKERELDKKKLNNVGCYVPFGTSNRNTTISLKRKASRGSLPCFTNVDV